ncbi:G8 domain-containing protein DDB_G0286311 [Rhizoctonia solani]|uniref:G8 domain-containing protein DDB_G0286311 n=1 Tax=Rhizoctonia solani TaxID=456999 RepID=A0A0K6FXX4_9AGAM|nr:G8 domain-containing protein DDB_G0286311 [Rhizoctonia solani]
MSNELSAAGDQLSSALDRYAQACSTTRDACLNGGQINNSPELLTSLDKQSSAITLYIQKLEAARASIQAARGSIPKVAPVSALPAEILGRIFRLVLPGQKCLVQRGYDGSISGIKYSIYPDALAHVCSFWRRVAITTPNLWTHIDIAVDHTLNPGLFARAKAYAIRAGQLPLEIHISDPGSKREQERSSAIREGKLRPGQPGYDKSHVWDDLHEFRILASDSANIKSLEIDLRVYNRYRETYYTMLEYFFARCKPGVFNKYITSNPYLFPSPFIEPAETPHSSDGALLAVPIRQLDEVWLGITSVRVGALCPHWKTTIYHGLVELYIDDGIPQIFILDLVNILKSSPKLQVFHFKAPLADDEDEIVNVNPIHLQDLRELSLIIQDDDFSTSKIIQSITPGTQPLCLSLADAPREEIVEFCSRANVTRLYIWRPGYMIPILNQCRRLETLVLNERYGDDADLSSILDDDNDADDAHGQSGVTPQPAHTVTRIHTLYVLWHAEIPFENIKAAVEKYSIQRLLIYCDEISYQADVGRVVSKNTRNIRAKLSTITACPTIEYHPEAYPEHYSEDELNDPDGWIRELVRFSIIVTVGHKYWTSYYSMSNELSTAGDQLGSVLDRYAQACSTTRDACLNGGQMNNSPELLANLEKQSSAITLYLRELEEARASIQAARGSIPKVAPVSALPAEILGRIFRLVLPGQTCLVQRGYDGSISGIKYPIHPDALAHVCSFWRRVAITSPSLWTHIDIAVDHSLNPGLFARAKVYTVRAGQLPLEIHISDPGSKREQERSSAIQEGKLKLGHPGYDASHVWDDLHDFRITSDSVNIKTLQMDLHVYNRYRETYYTMLEYFFARSKPGALTNYIALCSTSWAQSYFIEPAETPHSSDRALLAVPIRQLDEVWLGISSVRINGLCPYWTSKMYHGLVELYIGDGIPEIFASDLVNILKSSPKLRVFHFKAQLNGPDEDEAADTNHIYLQDLRELSLMIREDHFSVSRILQWITPGTEPLCLSLADAPREEIVGFCSRANVTRLYIWRPGYMIPILNQCRRLETLVLNALYGDGADLSSILDNEDDADTDDAEGQSGLTSQPAHTVTRIHTLYVLWHAEIPSENIKAAVEKYSIQRLLIYYGKISYQADVGRVVSKNTRNIRAKLSTITACPTIEYHPEAYPEHYSEDELNDPDGWIRELTRS